MIMMMMIAHGLFFGPFLREKKSQTIQLKMNEDCKVDE